MRWGPLGAPAYSMHSGRSHEHAMTHDSSLCGLQALEKEYRADIYFSDLLGEPCRPCVAPIPWGPILYSLLPPDTTNCRAMGCQGGASSCLGVRMPTARPFNALIEWHAPAPGAHTVCIGLFVSPHPARLPLLLPMAFAPVQNPAPPPLPPHHAVSAAPGLPREPTTLPFAQQELATGAELEASLPPRPKWLCCVAAAAWGGGQPAGAAYRLWGACAVALARTAGIG